MKKEERERRQKRRGKAGAFRRFLPLADIWRNYSFDLVSLSEHTLDTKLPDAGKTPYHLVHSYCFHSYLFKEWV